VGQDSLIAYVRAQKGKRFQIGQHDCFTFTNGWWRINRGRGFADGFEYSGLSSVQFSEALIRAYGTDDVIEALDGQLQRCKGYPPRGAIVAMPSARPEYIPVALGIAYGARAAFLGANDVVYVDMARVMGAWV
jgi:hypothetical protein